MDPKTEPTTTRAAAAAAPAPGFAAARKLIDASNRLPVVLQASDEGWRSKPSSGGLASALGGLEKDSSFLWVGWPGGDVPEKYRTDVTEMLAQDHLAPVYLRPHHETLFYHGICNNVLWPLFHYFTEKVRFDHQAWESYVEVNRMFADAILERCGPEDRVWVHDFHLMLVPRMLREERPDLQIGFFLHIPFPSSELYRLLPVREEILLGMLGSDYIGFHTNDHALHFRRACLRVLGLASYPDAVEHEGRRVGIGANPIGIDVAHFRRVLQSPGTRRIFDELQNRYSGRKVVLGVERLDYTKGIPLKLQAFERFLERNPDRASQVTLLQILVPSRLDNPEYIELKSHIEETIGRVNGLYGRPGVVPIEYLHRSVTPEQLVALYRFADVGLVIPVRDGMNLVAQEFVLCQQDHRGILVLSEFAGAAQYLAGAMLVNPWDVERTADVLELALAMPDHEKRERMAPMAQRVVEMDCQNWAEGFLAKLDAVAQHSRKLLLHAPMRGEAVADLERRFLEAERRILVLDYDGTLREITLSPEEARPTRELHDLLAELTSLPDVEVHVVSSRRRETMQAWLGDLPLHLSAEHGYVWRPPGGDWTQLHKVDLSWMPRVREILEQVANEVTGTMVEVKSCAVAWHYRMADLDYGVWRARELQNTLQEQLSHQPVEVLHGHRVVEVRARGVSKGRYVQKALEHGGAEFVLCIGDDRSDQDMYQVLPPQAVSIHVGAGGEGAKFSIESPARVRGLLRSLAFSAQAASEQARR